LALCRLALVPADRARLYRQLDERLRAMVDAGLVAEVRRLLSFPLMSAASPALRAGESASPRSSTTRPAA
jgi:tRNA A37 N6-isopentenylltransferase MiaA